MSRSLVDFVPTADVLRRHASLEHHILLSVLGIPTRFETNSVYVKHLIEESFGSWRNLPAVPDGDRTHALLVRVIVHEGTEYDDSGHAPIQHLCPDATRVMFHSPGSIAVADPQRGESVAYVTTALVADRGHFRVNLFEAMTLALLSHFDRHPVHAAAVVSGDRALLLAGRSGAGKSTLAYAAYAAGLDVLADDHVWVQLQPSLRVWGWPRRAHLLRDVALTFPEVTRLAQPIHYNGKEKLAFDLYDGAASIRRTDRASVCVLERGLGQPTLERLSPEFVATTLLDQVPAGFDRFPQRQGAVAEALSRGGGWRLTLSPDAREAIPLLCRMLDER
jgi:hypothetical protein